jgi:hypothetical protein
MIDMALYIAKAVINAEKQNVGGGAVLYRAYFIKIDTWDAYQADTNAILLTEGYGQCIVTA